jgi:S1-C subfamily serine protease
MRPRLPIPMLVCFCLLGALRPAQGQFVRELVNNQGANAPCTGIELGLGLIKKCIDTFANAGFIRVPEVGYSGITMGDGGADGAIKEVAAGSPAAGAGLAAGDRIVQVNEDVIQPEPGAVAQKAVFGPRGEDLALEIRRAGSVQTIMLKRTAQEPPKGPKSPSFLFIMHPLLDWRGVVIPCMGGGIAAPAAFAYCDKHFRPYGYIKFGDLGATGLHFDVKKTEAAVIASVDAGSAAEAAGVKPGDEVTGVDGHPLATDMSEQVRERMFGAVGTVVKLRVASGGATREVTLTLVKAPEK